MEKLGYIIWNPDLNAFGFIRWYSLCWLVGLVLAYLCVKRLYRQQGISDEKFEPLFVYCFVGILVGALDGAISRVDTMNRFPKTMKLFGYSAEESKRAIDKLSDGIEGLPTPLDSAVKSAQQLAITTGSLEKGTDLALAFNNAMIGYGASTDEAEQALRQFNQSLGSGKMQAEEFNSVSEAALKPVGFLSSGSPL